MENILYTMIKQPSETCDLNFNFEVLIFLSRDVHISALLKTAVPVLSPLGEEKKISLLF